jgi:hypothetical protein
LLGSLGALGCAADLGVGGGAMPSTGHAVGFGRLAASTKPLSTPMNEKDLMVGLALEGRGEQDVGSRFNLGATAGWALPADAIFNHFSFEAQLEGGTPLRMTLFEDGAFYLGASAALPFPLQKQRLVSNINQSTWILKRRFDLVPFVRVLEHYEKDRPFWDGFEISGGLALRYRVVSDLF